MNLIKLIDKQSNKLVSKSSGVGIDPFTGTPLYGANDSPNYTTTSINPFFSQFGIKTQQGINNYISGLSLKEFSQLPENLRLQYNNVWRQSQQANQAGQMFADAEANSGISSTASNNKLDLLDIYSKEADNRALARDRAYELGIADSTFQGISSLTNMGLDIWNAYEQSQTAKKQRELANEQIAASKELRNQRGKEIERLNKVRGNTAKAYNTGSVITRSY